MHTSNDIITKYKKEIENLNCLSYRDIQINDVCLRILGIHFMDYGEDWIVKKHRHSFFEFHYILDGRVNTTADDTENLIESGEFYLISPKTYHSHIQALSSKHIGIALRWEFIQVQKNKNLNCSDLKNILETLLGAKPIPIRDDNSIITMIDKIINSYNSGSSIIEMQILFYQMVVVISKFYQINPNNSIDVNTSFLEKNIINTAIQFIEENYMQDINVYEVAKSVHLSYSQLLRLFKKHTNETVNQYINSYRLKKSQMLLRCSSKPVGLIAIEVGFGSEIYFCSIFRKNFNMTPKEYRNNSNRLLE